MKDMIEQLKKEILEEILKELKHGSEITTETEKSETEESKIKESEIEEEYGKTKLEDGIIRVNRKPKPKAPEAKKEPTVTEVVEKYLTEGSIAGARYYLEAEFNVNIEEMPYEKFNCNSWEGIFDGLEPGTLNHVWDKRKVLFSFGLEKGKEKYRENEYHDFTYNEYSPNGKSEIIFFIFRQDVRANREPSGVFTKAWMIDVGEEPWFNLLK